MDNDELQILSFCPIKMGRKFQLFQVYSNSVFVMHGWTKLVDNICGQHLESLYRHFRLLTAKMKAT